MKTLILILSLTMLTSCLQRDVTIVGTIVSVENRGQACPRSHLKIQPAGTHLAGNLIEVTVPDLTDEKKALINQFINKPVTLKITTEEHAFCSSSTLEITDLK